MTEPSILLRPDRRAGWIAAGILLLVAIALRAQTFGNPVLGYDEQFYLVVGDRMLHGAIPFVDIFDRKPIGLFLIYGGIRLLGGDGTIQYQLVALAFVVATAIVIRTCALRVTGARGALFAGVAYLVWLNYCEGEGGQSPVFFNLPMALAGLMVARIVTREATAPGRTTAWDGLGPMLLVGLAIQIKYTALFEGMFFGLVLLHRVWRERPAVARLAWLGLVWAGAALLPTVAAWLAYVAIGQGQAFVFANFLSMFGKLGDPLDTSLYGLLTIAGVFLPLFVCAWKPPLAETQAQQAARRFVLQWLGAAIFGLFAMRSFSTPQYAMPMLVPAVLAAAPRFGAPGRAKPYLLGALGIALVASQLVLWSLQNLKGRAPEAEAVARAAMPHRGGCMFVYDGYPALYRLNQSCLMSRFVFPGHLNMTNEGNARALGVDPAVEVRRILAQRPETIVMDDPPFERVNEVTYRIVRAEVGRHYQLVLALPTGDRHRLVYRRVE